MTKSLKILVAATAMLAILCLYQGDWSFPADQLPQFRDALVAFALLSFVSEASYVRLRVGRSATHSSIVFIPFIASILIFTSGWTMLIATAVAAFAEHFVRQKPHIKIVFNASQHGLSVWAGSMVFALLGGIPALSGHAGGIGPGLVFPAQVPAIIGGVLTYFLVNITAVSAAVSLNDGAPLREAWLRIGSSQLAYDLVSSPLGILLAFLYVKLGMLGVLSILLPLFFVRRAYRATMELQEANRELLELMVKAIEARDPYTSGHSQRVSKLVGLLARQIGFGARHVEQVETAALLHDVGKIHEEYAPLLRKEGKLDATEKALMQTHALRSAELVSTISAFRGAITEAVRHHHENYNGTGYPDGLAGDDIPIGARMIMIADTVDAMTTDRPYRKALTIEQVHEELSAFSGVQFDADLVKAFMRSEAISEFVATRGGSLGAVGRIVPVSPWRPGTRSRALASIPDRPTR
jgi:putative nucleotidyltransferase with HDIG domain